MKPAIKAAGVLPYSKDAQGNTWFLLGREKPNQSWGIDSGSWSEFGGSILSSETPEEGAAREFFEETMGCMWNKTWMENELKNGRYLLAMDSKTPSGKGYRSFVKYVPFLDYPGRFARYKTLAKKQPEMFRRIVPDCFVGIDDTMSQNCVEKTSMGWFSVDQMRLAVEKYKNIRKSGIATTTTGTQHQRERGVGGNQRSYWEPDMIPHIRRGFAMDFDHLLTTSWARNNFQDDQLHFPLVKTPKISTNCIGEDDFEIIETSSGTLRPLVKTPRFAAATKPEPKKPKTDHRPKTPYTQKTLTENASSCKKPPIIKVSTAGYSFKKKRKRKRNRPDIQAATRAESLVVPNPNSQASDGLAMPIEHKKSPTSEPFNNNNHQQHHQDNNQWTMVTKKKKKQHVQPLNQSATNSTIFVINGGGGNVEVNHKSQEVYKPTRPIF